MAYYWITATPHHKEVPYSANAETVRASDETLQYQITLAAMRAIANVRRNGNDMRDDWTIVLGFKSANG